MRFGLPLDVRACLFDLDGVLTPTATLHATAWKTAFDEYLRARANAAKVTFVPFDSVADYDRYVDGKPRDDGARSFLASRGIQLSEGRPADAPGTESIHGVGNRKNEIFMQLLGEGRLAPYPGSVRYVHAIRSGGLSAAVVSSSRHCRQVLAAAGIAGLFDSVVDGVVAQERRLAGKPQPDTYVEAARAIGVAPGRSAVFEDALAGVEAGRSGRFGFVVGVDRVGQASALREHGADVVVADLGELLKEK